MPLYYAFLIIIMNIVGSVGSISQKFWQKNTLTSLNAPYIYTIVMSISACIYFYVMSNFNISVNATTFIYSAIYGLICMLSVVLTLVALSKMSIMVHSVFRNGKTVLVWIIGILFFNDEFTVKGLISILLVLCAILIPILKNTNQNTKKSGVLIGIFLILIDTASIVLLKLYGADAKKMSDSVLCFYTNVFMLVFSITFMLVSKDNHITKERFIYDLKNLKKYIFLPFIAALSSNSTSLIQLYLVRIMPLSLYSTLSYAIGCILGPVFLFINTKIIFKEKNTKSDIIAYILSAFSLLVTLI